MKRIILFGRIPVRPQFGRICNPAAFEYKDL